MKRRTLLLLTVAIAAGAGCRRMPPAPVFEQPGDEAEAAYSPYLAKGTSTVSGQAFLTQKNGGVVKAAGRTVTLDPATSTADDWWRRAGRMWHYRHMTPPSPAFHKARRTVTADADGRFKFVDLPAGTYYVRTEVTWEIGGYNPTQGGLVGTQIKVRPSTNEEVILNQVTQ